MGATFVITFQDATRHLPVHIWEVIESQLFTKPGLEGGLFFRWTFQPRFYKCLSVRLLLIVGWKVRSVESAEMRSEGDGRWLSKALPSAEDRRGDAKRPPEIGLLTATVRKPEADALHTLGMTIRDARSGRA